MLNENKRHRVFEMSSDLVYNGTVWVYYFQKVLIISYEIQ